MVKPPKINQDMLSVFEIGKNESISLTNGNPNMTKKLLMDSANKRPKPIAINPFNLKDDLRAYVEPIYGSTDEAVKIADEITATYFQGNKPEDYHIASNAVIIEKFEDHGMPIFENFMDLIHEAHS